MQLIDKEAVIKILDDSFKKYSDTDVVTDAIIRVYNLEIKREISSLPIYGEWISINERLPNNSDDILIYGIFGFVNTAIGRYHKGEGFVQPSTIGWYKANNVTHWQPLPPPPNQ